MNAKERALSEIALAEEVFGIGNDLQPRKGIRGQDISAFLEHIAKTIWPLNDKGPSIIVGDDPQRLRGFYWGEQQLDRLTNVVSRQSLFFDQLVLLDPLAKMAHARGKEGPYENPGQYASMIVNDAIYVCSLKKWIQGDLILMIPPASIDSKLMVAYAEKGRVDLADTFEKLKEDRHWRNKMLSRQMEALALNLPKPVFLKMVPSPPFDPTFSERFYDESRRLHPKNFKYCEVGDPEELKTPEGFHASYTRLGPGVNILEAVDLASASGSILFSDDAAEWDLVLKRQPLTEVSRELQKITVGIQKLEFHFLNDVPLETVLQLKLEGRLSGFRILLKDLWRKLPEAKSVEDIYKTAHEFNDRLVSEYGGYQKELDSIGKQIVRDVVGKTMESPITQAFGIGGSLLVLNGTFDWSSWLAGIAISIVGPAYKPIAEGMARKETLQQSPLFVLRSVERASN